MQVSSADRSSSGYCAFTHKAGIHAKAILNNPSTYEILKPEDFGLTRYVSIGHRLTGWNAVKSRVEQLGLKLTDDEVRPFGRSPRRTSVATADSCTLRTDQGCNREDQGARGRPHAVDG